jgi:hypothetical protein
MPEVKRNFSMQTYWERITEDWEPLLKFKGKTRSDWTTWRKKASSKFLELLGSFPKKVSLQAEVESSVEDGDLIRERVVFNSEEFISVPCQVLKPKRMKKDKSNPAILCSHGHGQFGKDPVAGVRSSKEHLENIAILTLSPAETLAILTLSKAPFWESIPLPSISGT